MKQILTKMTITYENKVNSINRDLRVVAFNFNNLVNLVSKLPWLIALFFLLVFGSLYTLFAYVPTYSMRKSVAKLANHLKSKGVADISQREAMERHTQSEDLRLRIESIVSRGGGFFIIKPIITELQRAGVQFKIMEDILFKAAYPDYEKPLTKDEENQLKGLYKGWTEDWADEKMDVYND